MANYRPYLTDDGSIGLFSGDYDDIFHSRYGALTEAYEKFILPANLNELLRNKSQINVLDICYGIGYNSKAFLNELIKNFFKNISESKENSIVSKYSDKNSDINKSYCNGSICADKKYGMQDIVLGTEASGKSSVENFDKICSDEFLDEYDAENDINMPAFYQEKNYFNELGEVSPSVNIDALEFEKEFVFLSPFVKEMTFNARYKLSPIVANIISKNLYEQYGEAYIKSVKNLKAMKEYSKFFNNSRVKQIKKYCTKGCKYILNNDKKALLHNIYYENVSKRTARRIGFLSNRHYWYISKREKELLEKFDNFINNIKINFFTDDARKEIVKLDKKYNLIFLDAFTPSKLPTLWSVEFFSKIYNLISADGLLLTYTTSARVRNAMKEAGFNVGVIKSGDSHLIGTVASKNPLNISHQLSPKDLGLLETKSGIPYRDANLSSSSEEILANLKLEIENSNKQSSSQYLKGVTNEI